MGNPPPPPPPHMACTQYTHPLANFLMVPIPHPSGPTYRYTSDLWALHQASAASLSCPIPVTSNWQPSPLPPAIWAAALQRHPDRHLAEYVIRGLEDGFRIGFDSARRTLRPASRNMGSAYATPQVVSEYLQKECILGRVLGPLQSPPPGLMVSKFGVIPKRYQAGKWRLILDLSSPRDASVNDGIDQDLAAIRYPSVDVAAQLILQAGQGALLSKVDIKEAYRIIPVHQDDWRLLGMQWDNLFFIDTRLPFGLRSAPKIFSAVADALQWILTQWGAPTCIHYLDDYLFVEPPGSHGKVLTIVTPLLAALGVPTAPQKMEGPSTTITFLGIELDSIALTARLPPEKLQRLVQILQEWGDRRRCTKRELLSLIGILQHAATVIRFGRAFVRALIDLAHSISALHHHIYLNQEVRADLLWWEAFAPSWNGSCFLAPALLARPASTVATDASGSWGCGALWQGHWFQFT